VSKAEKIIDQMRRSTPWHGDPRVNIQRGKDGNAKAYQVRQVLDAIASIEAENSEEEDDDDA
jgi:hypothetical protein